MKHASASVHEADRLRSLRRWVARIGALLHGIVYVAVVALAAVMLLAIGWQVMLRYLFNRPPSWTEELALLCFTWTMLLMMAIGVRQAFHANIDLLGKLLPRIAALWLERAILLATLCFGVYLARGGATYVLETATATSAAIAYPIYVLHSAAPVCGALVAWFAFERLIAPAEATAPPRTSPQTVPPDAPQNEASSGLPAARG